jgi:hypothetical protein
MDPENTDANRVDLGYGDASGAGLLGRVVGRLMWPRLRHQVALNGEVLARLEELSRRLDYFDAKLELSHRQALTHADTLAAAVRKEIAKRPRSELPRPRDPATPTDQ